MKKGSIILVPFYYTDYSNYKLRSSLIVSGSQSNLDDYIVAFISSAIPSTFALHKTHFILDSNQDYFVETGLKITSILKCDKLMTINKSIVAGLLGELNINIIRIVDQKLKMALLLR